MPVYVAALLGQSVQQQTQQAQPLVEAGGTGPVHDLPGDVAAEDAVDLIIRPVSVEKIVVNSEILGDPGVLEILDHQILVHGQAVLFKKTDHVAQIRPASGCDEALSVHGGLDPEEIGLFDIQIGGDGGVDAGAQGKLLPDAVIGLHVDALQAVPGDDIEVPDRAVELRRVAGGDHDPAVGNTVTAEDLELQELQHGGGQSLGNTVDLIQEQDALPEAGLLHGVIHAGDDLGHGVLADSVLPAAVDLLLDEGQTQGALPCVMGHGIAHQPHAQLLGDLLHNGGLADARRAHEKDRPLLFQGDHIGPELVFCKIRRHGVFDLLFCLLDIHGFILSAVCFR